MIKDYYRVLNVSPAATKQAIRKSYRELAARFHPDKNQSKSAEERFKQIAEAYNVLSNEIKRKEYDQSRKVVDRNSFQTHSSHAKQNTPPKERGKTFSSKRIFRCFYCYGINFGRSP